MAINRKWKIENGKEVSGWAARLTGRTGSAIFRFPIAIFLNLKSQISNLKWLWWWLRQVSGDAAYERYLEHASRCPHAPLSRDEFYLDALRRRYSGVSRCC